MARVISQMAFEVYGCDIEGWTGSSEACFRGHRRSNRYKSVFITEGQKKKKKKNFKRPTFKGNFRKRILFCSSSICFDILIILVELVTFRVVADGISLEYVTLIPGMFNFLGQQQKQPSAPALQRLECGQPYLLVKLLGMNIAKRACANVVCILV